MIHILTALLRRLVNRELKKLEHGHDYPYLKQTQKALTTLFMACTQVMNIYKPEDENWTSVKSQIDKTHVVLFRER